MFKERCEFFAEYIIKEKTTIRSTAKKFGLSKSTVHFDLKNKLKKVNPLLFVDVQKQLQINFLNKHINGGIATKNKYKNNHKKDT